MQTTTSKIDTKQEYILEKGMELLWSKGYNGTSVNDIVNAAEIPKGSFYFYFDSKEDFVVKALEYYFNIQLIVVSEILADPQKSPKERLYNLMDYKVTMVRDQLGCKMGCMASNLGSEMSDHSDEIREVITRNEKKYKHLLTDIVHKAQKEGEINADLEAAVFVEFMQNSGKGALLTMKERQDISPVINWTKMVKYILEK